MDPVFLNYVIRLVHTGAAAFVVGGAVLLWAQVSRVRLAGAPASEPEIELPLPVPLPRLTEAEERMASTAHTSVPPLGAAAVIYEWGFWVAVGLLTMTGIGNLAAFGAALPGGQTEWGTRLLVKLAAVAVLVAFSSWRTLVVARGAHRSELRQGLPRVLYGATAVLSLVVLGLAVGLAHP